MGLCIWSLRRHYPDQVIRSANNSPSQPNLGSRPGFDRMVDAISLRLQTGLHKQLGQSAGLRIIRIQKPSRFPASTNGRMAKRTKQPEPRLTDPGDDDREQRLGQTLGIAFRDPSLLRLALTHRSVAHEVRSIAPDQELSPALRSNERLEFLGDSILGYIVANDLYARYPDAPEGDLTSRRVALVRAERLVAWARAIDLGDYLYLAQGERISESNRDRMLSGAFEALIAAVALDQGIEAAARFVQRFLDADVEDSLAEGIAANPKGKLQEYVQEHYRQAPIYRIIGEVGPDHARTFTAEVFVNDQQMGIGEGESKRAAEQAAAAVALGLLTDPSDQRASGTVRKRRKRTVKGGQAGNG